MASSFQDISTHLFSVISFSTIFQITVISVAFQKSSIFPCKLSLMFSFPELFAMQTQLLIVSLNPPLKFWI